MSTSVPGNSCRPCTNISATTGCLVRVSGACVYYSGSALAGPGINVADTFDTVVTKLTTYIQSVPVPSTFTPTRIPFAGSTGDLTENATLSFGPTPFTTTPTLITPGITALGTTYDAYGYGHVSITTYGRTGLIGDITNPFGAGIGDASTMAVNNTISEGYAGLYSWPAVTGTGATWRVAGGHKFPNYIAGVSSAPANRNAGATLSTMLGVFSAFNTDANCTVTNAYHFYASNINTIQYNIGNGTVTNQYGFYCENFNYATNNYGIYINGTQKNYIGGTLGIGQNNPTAKLHLSAGTATASTAPVKLTSGTLLTTPETGAVEYDGSRFYGTVGSDRRVVDRLYKVYTAIVNQSGTNNPVATVLENTLGVTITWTRDGLSGDGTYFATASSAIFVAGKSTIFTGSLNSPGFCVASNLSTSTFSIVTYDPASVAVDNLLGLTFVEIRLYP